MPHVSTRRDEVLAAAMNVLGELGSRALTHRNVDRSAGLPQGTTSNYFRTRDALVAGVLDYVGRVEAETLASLDGGLRRSDAAAVTSLAAQMIQFLLGPGRTLTLARHALFLEASFRPELRAELLRSSQTWWTLASDLLAVAGSRSPQTHGRWLLAYIDGLLADQLCRPDPAFDPEAAVRAALEGMVPSPKPR